MIIYTTKAREGDSHPLQISWADEIGRPLVVQDVQYSIFKYEGAVRTEVQAVAPMSPTDHDYRFVARYEIPEGTAGQVLYALFQATLVADGTALIAEQVLQIEKSITTQRLNVSL